MIERIIEFSVRHRLLVILAGLALGVWGVYALYHTPVDAIPDLSENQVIVFTDWTGHSPREIEDQVTYPLTLHLQGLAGVRVVRSSSDINFSMISVIFEDSVPFAAARQQVAERLARAGAALPAGVVPRLAPDAAATGQIYWYTVEGPGYDLGRLRAVQDWYVAPQLSSVPGVAEVASVGGAPLEYQVNVDPQRLRAYGISVSQVAEALSRSNSAVGSNVVHKGNAEFVVRGVGWLGSGPHGANADPDPRRILRALEKVALRGANGANLCVADVAAVALGTQPRRGVLEKDGNEVTGGVVLMRQGENPLEVTHRLKQKIQELQAGLPLGVRLVSFYDRTPLIEGALRTVAGTVIEAIITAAVCVLLVLLHFRTSFIIAVTLPLAVLMSFGLLWALRQLGVADVQTNIMSLAGIAISVGVLVDSSVVMAENVMHHLHEHFGDRPVHGDTRPWVVAACRTVGRPIFFSVLIMLLSFLPVFALGGMEGKMFRPLAFTKSFALLAVGVLAVTLVPALCTVFIKGRLRGENESWLVRNVIQAYRPTLTYFLDHPAPLVWFIGVTFLVGVAPLGVRWVFLLTLAATLLVNARVPRTGRGKLAASLSLVVVALLADQHIRPLDREFMTPLDEGMVMDMPISVPRVSVTQAGDDLKARDMILCRFPEVDMVVGKAGRAETPLDPAPLDMIETMVNFRPQEFWPRRKLRTADAERQDADVLDALVARRLVAPPQDRAALLNDVGMKLMPLFDAQMREYAYQRNKEFERELGGQLVAFAVGRTVAMIDGRGLLHRTPTASDLALLSGHLAHDHAAHLGMPPELEEVTALAQEMARQLVRHGFLGEGGDPLQYRPDILHRAAYAVHSALGGHAPTFFTALRDAVLSEYQSRWGEHVGKLNGELLERGAAIFTRLAIEELLAQATVTDESVRAYLREVRRVRSQPTPALHHAGEHHHGMSASLPALDPVPVLNNLQKELTENFTRRVLLWPKDRADLVGFGSEPDRVMQMPGWTNVWTMPIQNRVDMLSTGVNTAVGIRVLGRNLEDVVRASEDIAAAIKRLPGAADVVADPVRGKGYLEVHPDRDKLAAFGLSVADVNELVETAVGGKVVTTTIEGRERHPVRLRYPRSWREDEESVRNLLVPLPPKGTPSAGPVKHVPLSELAAVTVVEGPATIKSENGLLRNYVRLNVRGRDAAGFVDEARQAVAARVRVPAGVYLEWTGQFEHEARARQTLLLIVPLVVLLIFLILYWTYHDVADAALMLLAVPGAVAGGIFCQWLFGAKLSVTVWVGYIACFGMATSTGIIMLVYLREAVAKAGPFAELSLDRLRQAVLDGAVHRLRPKLLTEGTMVLGLAPLLWAQGTGAEVIRPMVLPVLGGILIADEVIDLLLPVLFFHERRRRWLRLQPARFLLARRPAVA
jgi:Cu(I)/Ag(I) efflux system membrane protein CusA/SilA